MRLIALYVIGLIFGLGISISGMANPAKVLNFFDFAGSWDPSLAFVMAGGLIITFIGYRFVFRMPTPLMESSFRLPTNTRLDARLIGGAAIFGVGWGISGFCPGGALPVMATGSIEVLLFVASLIGGIFAVRAYDTYRATKKLSGTDAQTSIS